MRKPWKTSMISWGNSKTNEKFMRKPQKFPISHKTPDVVAMRIFLRRDHINLEENRILKMRKHDKIRKI